MFGHLHQSIDQRWAIIGHQRSSIIDHRSPSSMIGIHVLDRLAGNNMDQSSLARSGPTTPSSTRWVAQFVARTVQRFEHAAGCRVDFPMGGKMSSRREYELPTQSSSGLTRFEQIADAHSVLAEHAAAPEPEFGPWRHRHSSASRRAC